MQFSVLLTAFLTAAVSALPTPSQPQRRAYTYWPVVSDPGFYAVSYPPEWNENQILQWFTDNSAGSSSLVGKFPAGFAIRQDGPAKLNVYTRVSGGTGSYLGSIGPLPVENGVVTEDVSVVIATFPNKEIFTFEFIVESDVENASIAFVENDEAGFFIRTGSA